MTENTIFDAITILNKRFYFNFIKVAKVYNVAIYTI